MTAAGSQDRPEADRPATTVARPPADGTPPAEGAARFPARGSSAGRALARVTGRQALGSLVWLTLEVPVWPGARPGQFALLQAEDTRCFLGRALSVAQEQGDLVSFLVAPVGEGTRELCALEEGERVWVLGPLGNGFALDALTAGPGRLLVVAGGVGAAPFPLLLSSLARGPAERQAGEVLVLLGFRDAAQAAGARPVVDAATALAERAGKCRTQVVAEDGSVGRAEKVTETLRREVLPGDRLAVCGPWTMAESVARICLETANVSAWFSVEAGMACGVGSCHGCVVPLTGGTMARVCHEGPVFTADALFGPGFHASTGAPRG